MNRELSRSAAKHRDDFKNYLTRAKREFEHNYRAAIKPNASLSSFNMVAMLGKGTFGKVFKVRQVNTNLVFAMKALEKRYVAKIKQIEHLVDEIKILNSVNFEFLIRLRFYFKNGVYVFLVLDYVEGGEFFYSLRKVRSMNEDHARFYAGQVVLALEYLHYIGVIYRDLKPENLILSISGYLKLVDFGFAKKIGRKRTYTLCGTPEYLAPEMILSRGYSVNTDWWSVGVLIHEMVAGVPPFMASDHWKLYEKIIAGKIDWSSNFSLPLRNLLQGMLTVDRSKRLGYLRNESDDIKYHKWFAPLDWDALLAKQLKPPNIPIVPPSPPKRDPAMELRTNEVEECPEFNTLDIFLM